MNSLLRTALRALLEADSRIDSDKINAPLGGGGSVEVEKLTTYEHTGKVVYQLTLTPPPLGTGQNAVHTDDDDGNDGGIGADDDKNALAAIAMMKRKHGVK